MKRILSIITVLFVLFSCSINCFAAGNGNTISGNVYGKYNYFSDANVYTANSDNGKYQIETEDGVKIIIRSKSSDLILIVHQISKDEKEAYEWIKSCVPQSIIRYIPYDIFFLNASGERIELSSEDEVTISSINQNQYILGLSSDGNITEISCAKYNERITFKVSTISNYYLLCEKAMAVNSPPTGDTSNIYLWLILLLVSFVCLIITASKAYKFKRKV